MSEESVLLRVFGRDFDGWKSLEIVSSLENAARAFHFVASERWPGESNPIRLKPGSPCEVLAGGDLLITGYIDSVQIAASAGAHEIAVAGRSKTADLVDCSAEFETGRWRNKKIEQIANDLAKPYDVTIKAQVDTGDKIKRHAIQRGETVYSSIERLARLRALLVTDNADGDLVLTRAGNFATDAGGGVVFSETGTGTASTALVVGENVISSQVSFDMSGRFSEYRVKGIRAGDDLDFGEVLQTSAESEDSDVERTRVLIVEPEARSDKKRCKVRADWEAATRFGRSLSLTYIVQGWRQEDGRLWEVNNMVSVVDALAGIEADLLIVEVVFSISQNGTLTTLTLSPVEGFEPIAPQKKRPRTKKAGTKKGAFDEIKEGVKVSQ